MTFSGQAPCISKLLAIGKEMELSSATGVFTNCDFH